MAPDSSKVAPRGLKEAPKARGPRSFRWMIPFVDVVVVVVAAVAVAAAIRPPPPPFPLTPPPASPPCVAPIPAAIICPSAARIAARWPWARARGVECNAPQRVNGGTFIVLGSLPDQGSMRDLEGPLPAFPRSSDGQGAPPTKLPGRSLGPQNAIPKKAPQWLKSSAGHNITISRGRWGGESYGAAASSRVIVWGSRCGMLLRFPPGAS